MEMDEFNFMVHLFFLKSCFEKTCKIKYFLIIKEFAFVMTSKFYKKKSDKDIIAAFKEYDTDQNGSLCVKEIEKVLKNFRGKRISFKNTNIDIVKRDKVRI